MTIEPTALNGEIETLLAAAQLPVADLHDSDTLHLFALHMDERMVGVVGAEVYGKVALLRSLAIHADFRKAGYGQKLVTHAETWATAQGIECLYLLTTTADRFFSRIGYKIADRNLAPAAISGTAQFSGLCPSSATFMCKLLQ